MRKTGMLIWMFAIAAGIFGACLRYIELHTVFDKDTGLAYMYAPVSLALMGLTAFAALVFLVFCVRLKSDASVGYKSAFGRDTGLAGIITAICAVLVIICGVLDTTRLILGHSYKTQNIMWLGLWSVLSVVTGISLLVLSLQSCKRGREVQPSIFAMIPALFLCVWLIYAYMNRAADPVILDYIYEFLALAALVLGYYYVAGFEIGKGKPKKMVFFSLLSVYFSAVTLADSHSLYRKGMFLFLALILLFLALRIIRNVKLGGVSEETRA